SLQQRLNVRSTARSELLSRRRTEAQAAAADKEIDTLTAQFQEVEAQIRAASPRYAALTQPQPLSAPEIRQMLDSDTLLLEFALGKERSYLWAVTPDSITSYQLPPRAEIEAAAMRVRDLLVSRRDETDVDYRIQLDGLSRMLLGPIGAQLSAKRFLIVSSGALQYVPFAVLSVSAKNGGTAYQPLIVEHEIVNLPSASALAVMRRESTGRQSAVKAAAVLADPVFGWDDPRIGVGGKTRTAPSPSRAQAHRVEAREAAPSPLAPSELERAVRDVSLGENQRPLSRLP